MIRCILFTLLLSLSSMCAAKPTTLADYIEENCVSNCIDDMSLLTSALNAADDFNIDVRVLLAIIKVESGFRINARSPSSMGLMQVNARVHRHKFRHSIFNPMENIRVGTLIFSECLERANGNFSKAFRCYNGAGKGQGRSYISKVQQALAEIKRLTLV